MGKRAEMSSIYLMKIIEHNMGAATTFKGWSWHVVSIVQKYSWRGWVVWKS